MIQNTRFRVIESAFAYRTDMVYPGSVRSAAPIMDSPSLDLTFSTTSTFGLA